MTALAEIRAQVAAAFQGGGGLTAYDDPPEEPTPPCAVVEPEEVDFRPARAGGFRRGGEQWTLSVFVLISPADAANAARKTDEFFDRSANDLKDAIEGAFDGRPSIEVAGGDRWGEYPFPSGLRLAGFRLVCEVLT